MDIKGIREKYPQYNDLSDRDLADALHKKFYPNMDRAEFDSRIGLAPQGVGEYAADVAEDAARSTASGLAELTAGTLEAPADIADLGSQFGIGQAPGAVGALMSGVAQGSGMIRDYLAGDSALAKATRATREYEPKYQLGRGLKLGSQFAPGAIGSKVGAGARALKYVAAPTAGGLIGGEIAESQGMDRSTGEAVGSLGGVFAGAPVINKIARGSGRKALPTEESFLKKADSDYNLFKQSDVVVTPEAAAQAKQAVRRFLTDEGFNPDLNRKAGREIASSLKAFGAGQSVKVSRGPGLRDTMLGPINQTQYSPVPLKEIADQSSRLGEVARKAGDQDAFFIRGAKKALEDAVRSVPQSQVVSGNIRPAQEAIDSARANYTRYSQLKEFNNLSKKAQRSGVGNQQRGGHEENVIRNLTTFLNKPIKKKQYFSPEQTKAMENVVAGNTISRTLRGLGKPSLSISNASATGGVPAGVAALAGVEPLTVGLIYGGISGGSLLSRLGHKKMVRDAIDNARSVISTGDRFQTPWTSAIGRLNTLNSIRNQAQSDG